MFFVLIVSTITICCPAATFVLEQDEPDDFDKEAELIQFKETSKPWFDAIISGKLIEIEECLLRTPIDTKDHRFGSTALHYAVQTGQLAIVSFLISKKAALNIKNKQGLTPLHVSVSWQRLEELKLLLAAGADTSITNNDGETAQHLAQSQNAENMMKLILAYSIEVPAARLFAAIDTEQLVLIKKTLATDAQALLTHKDDSGDTALHKAVKKNNLEIVKVLLLHAPECVSALLEVPNNDGVTPIELAARDKKKEMHNKILQFFMEFAYIPKAETNTGGSCIIM